MDALRHDDSVACLAGTDGWIYDEDTSVLRRTTTEHMVFREGQLTNGSLADYKIPGLLDMPTE